MLDYWPSACIIQRILWHFQVTKAFKLTCIYWKHLVWLKKMRFFSKLSSFLIQFEGEKKNGNTLRTNILECCHNYIFQLGSRNHNTSYFKYIHFLFLAVWAHHPLIKPRQEYIGYWHSVVVLLQCLYFLEDPQQTKTIQKTHPLESLLYAACVFLSCLMKDELCSLQGFWLGCGPFW